jgi:dipeptidase D
MDSASTPTGEAKMGDVLGNLKPAPIWKHFEKLCSIPRPSRHEQQAAAYVYEFAKSCGLQALRDEAGNVIVKKPATKGMENRRTVVLQTHLDMVPQKNQDVAHDFTKDPIKPRVEGEIVKATGTTLGADNGIGVAAALAVLEAKDLVHGPVEALFTIDEEAGMTGANKLKGGLLDGDILFNLDSEDEGELCIGCAGGMDVVATLAYKGEPASGTAYKLSLSGLKGGHSGVDIHLGRANANKVMTRLLWEARREMELRIATWEGGDLRNAIPRWANAVVTVPADKAAAFEKKIAAVIADIQKEFAAVDPGIKLAVEKTATPPAVIDKTVGDRLLNALYAAPHGVFAMIRDMPTVTETSTNLAIVKSGNGEVVVTNMLRSSVDTKKTDVGNMIRSVFEAAGAAVDSSGSYPGWQPYTASPVLKMLRELYQKQFGKTPHVTATHGGLECGIIRSNYPAMDAVSFGPTIKYPHSPDEFVEVPSVQKFWDFLTEALKHVPQKGVV